MDFHISVTTALNITMNGARHIGYSIEIINQIFLNVNIAILTNHQVNN